MEKDQGSWLYHVQPDGQFLNTNNISSSLFGSPKPNGVPANGFLPGYPYSGIPQSKVGQLTEQFGWSYCLPRFRQAFTSMQNRSSAQRENLKESIEPNNPAPLQQKRFLVFDQSGDQTTLMFSSGIGNHVPALASMVHKFDNVCAPLRMNEGNRVNMGHLTEKFNEYHNDETESEMREDTEELNALLYSDDDSDCDYEEEEEEEVSTGHSPNTESGEDEVASSVGQTVEEGEEVFDDVQSVMDTASSGKRKRCFEDEQDAESYCTGGEKKKKKQPKAGLECDDGRSKKEKIRETVGILQKIIPGSRGKDAIVVLDEAIAYLKALQCKAEAVGFQIS